MFGAHLRLAAALLTTVLLHIGAAHSCTDGSRVQCIEVEPNAGAPSTKGEGYGAQGYPFCTPAGKKMFCLVDHDYHICSGGKVPCCEDGSFPEHAGYQESAKYTGDDITCSAAAPATEGWQMVLDDMDKSLSTTMANAHEGSYQPCMKDAYNGQFHHDWAQKKGKAHFSYAFNPPADGCYKIEEYHPGSDWQCSRYLPKNAHLDVDFCKGLSTTLYINQAEKAAQWNEIGRFRFYKGNMGRLTMRNSLEEQCGDNCFWVADAFRLTLVGDLESCPQLQTEVTKNTNPLVPSALVHQSSTEPVEGVLLLRARLADAAADLQATLEMYESKIAAVLADFLGRATVSIVKMIATGGRRLQGNSAASIEVHFVASGRAMAYTTSGDLGQSLQAALKAEGVDIQVESANLQWAPEMTNGTGDSEDPDDHFPWAIVCTVGAAGFILLSMAIGCYFHYAKRAVNKLPTGVIAMEAGATKDVEGAQADLECAKEKDVKAVSEDAEIASVSTDTPASEAPASDEGSVNEVHSTAPTGKDGTEVGGSRVLA